MAIYGRGEWTTVSGRRRRAPGGPDPAPFDHGRGGIRCARTSDFSSGQDPMPTGKGGARKGQRRPRGRKRAAGGKRLGRMTAGGAEVWVSHDGRRRGIGN